jgi:sugar (pentulose or hexulose) kinase
LFLVLCIESLLGACASVVTRVAVTGVGVSTIGISNALAVLASHRTWNSSRSASVAERIS